MSDANSIQLNGWQNLFDSSVLASGFKYFEAGTVSGLNITRAVSSESPWHIRGVVSEKNRESAEVHIQGKSTGDDLTTMESGCNCRQLPHCRHAAALLYYATGQAIPSVRNPNHSLSSQVHDWLHQVRNASAASGAPGVERSKSSSQLVYVLEEHRMGAHRRLNIECCKVRPLKRGGFSGRQNYDMRNLLLEERAPNFAVPDDVLIARHAFLAGLMKFNHASSLQVHAQVSDELLRTVLRTGNAFWGQLGNPPITLGEKRVAMPEWIVGDDGVVRPMCRIDPPATAFLPMQPPWYYDAETNVCGPLDMGMPGPLLAAWLAAPEMSADEAVAVGEVLTEPALTEVPIPKPEGVTTELIKDCKPVPVLQLFTRMAKWWELSDTYTGEADDLLPLHYAKLLFDYRGMRADWKAKSTHLQCGKGNHVVRVQRQPVIERKWVERLVVAGLTLPQFHAYTFESTLTIDGALEKPWHEFVIHQIPKLEAEGWRIEYDPSFAARVVEPDDWFAELTPKDDADDWFGLELGIIVGGKRLNLLPVLLGALRDETLSLEEVRKPGKGKYINVRLPDGSILPFPAARLCEILDVLVELFDPGALDGDDILRLNRVRVAQLSALSATHWSWRGGEALREMGRKLGGVRELPPVPPPAGLRATLRPYQLDGLSWLQFLREFELAGILADDMGLGKTVQALAHLLIEKEAGRLDRPSLVVAPTSLMVNWGAEAKRFAPDLKVLTFHGYERKQGFDSLAEYDLVLTTYTLLVRDETLLAATNWHLLVLDEAQYIKNHRTKYAQIASSLKARHRLCLTGTPMENHLGELWSIFNFLLPGFLGENARFGRLFRTPIERNRDVERRDALVRRVTPFILRRRKDQVAAELPPKTEVLSQVELDGAQRDLYESIRLAMHEKVQAEVSRNGVANSRIIILDALLKLRQVCCDPRLLKLESARKVTESAKLELLMELLPEMLGEGRRILLFSQFTSMLDLIEKRLAKLEYQEAPLRWAKLIGATKDRATPVSLFQEGHVPLFLISLKAGGTGLNLTAADTVVHYDPWWNPAVENQATDRAHRIGQDKKVFVYKLITKGTVEEKIVAMQERKRELVDGLLNSDPKANFSLTADDIEFLFAPLDQTV